MKKIIVYAVLIPSCTTPGYSQTTTEIMENIQHAFRQLDYDKAKEEAQKVIQSWQQYEPTQLIEVHKILGVIAYTEGRLVESQAQFHQALSLDNFTTLDSVYISPKIIAFFSKIKSDFKMISAIAPPDEIRYLLIPDPRPEAFFRSFILPGWGQLYKGHKNKGRVIISATAISIISNITLYFLQDAAHEKYLDASNEEVIEKKYEDYNRWYQYWRSSTVITGAIWLYSLADAMISTPALPHKPAAFMVQPACSGNQINLTATWHF